MKTFWIVKCFGRNGGLIWEERLSTREGAQHVVDCCKRFGCKRDGLKYEIKKVSYYS